MFGFAGCLLITCVSSASAVDLQFAQRTWKVKQAAEPVGPGPNRFSSNPDDVWVDDNGLHLTIHKHGAFWYSTEVILNESLGYGTYAFQTTSRQDILNANATFGAFTWDTAGGDTIPDNPNREIDFEDGRWGNANDPTNSQVVVQPYYKSGNLKRITLPDLSDNADLTRFFTWSPGKVEFYTLRGHTRPPISPRSQSFITTSTSTMARIGLCHIQGPRTSASISGYSAASAPVDEQNVEVVINDFTFLPLKPGDFNNDGAVNGLDLQQWQGDYGQNRFSDADGDGVSDGRDFLIWQRSIDGSPAMVLVPEPTCLTLGLAWWPMGWQLLTSRRANLRKGIEDDIH